MRQFGSIVNYFKEKKNDSNTNRNSIHLNNWEMNKK